MATTGSKRPPEFGPTQRLQRNYERGIRQVTSRVLLPPKPAETLQQWLTRLTQRAQQPDIMQASRLLAERMVTNIRVVNARTWREAASRSSQAQRLHRLLQAEMQGATGAHVQRLIRENAKLISSVSLEAAETLVKEVTAAQQNGARPKTVAKMMRRRFPELLRSRTHLISRTETAKASTELTKARCDRLAIDWYQWESSKDQRTRESHLNMHGVIVSWAHPPSPEALVGEKSYGNYAAGEIFNCRCTVIPILTLDDIKFPARVHWNGRIQRMTKQEFKRIAVGLEQRTAA